MGVSAFQAETPCYRSGETTERWSRMVGQLIRFISPVLLLAGCSTSGSTTGAAIFPSGHIGDWRTVVTPGDRERLREWRDAFVGALGEARRAGFTNAIERHAALLDPDAGLHEPIPPGRYRCRTVKLGTIKAGLVPYKLYPFHECAVARDGGVASFTALGGLQRPTGRIFNAGDGRQIFLGTLMLGDETRALNYGRDTERDMAGIVEKIGERTWRLVLPYPHFESRIDIVEIAPATGPTGKEGL